MQEPNLRKPKVVETEPLSGILRHEPRYTGTPSLLTPASRAPVLTPLESRKKKCAISPFGMSHYDDKVIKSAVSFKSVERINEQKDSEAALDYHQPPAFMHQA